MVFECYNICDMNKCCFYLISEEISVCSTLSVSGSLLIRHISIHICNWSNPHSYLYPSLSMFKSESDRKCENKYKFASGVRWWPPDPLKMTKGVDCCYRDGSGHLHLTPPVAKERWQNLLENLWIYKYILPPYSKRKSFWTRFGSNIGNINHE